MKSTGYSLIDKVFVEVNTTNMETANHIKNNISQFLQDEIFPEIEYILNQLDPVDEFLRIDSISLDVNKPFNDVAEIKEEIIRSFSEKLNKISGTMERTILPDFSVIEPDKINSEKENISIISPRPRGKDLFLFFIQKGYLPWYASRSDFIFFISEDIWAEQLHDSDFVLRVKELLTKDKIAGKRFVLQTNERVVWSFLIELKFIKESTFERIRPILRNIPFGSKELMLEFMLHFSLGVDSEKSVDNFMETSILSSVEKNIFSKTEFQKPLSTIIAILNGETEKSEGHRVVKPFSDKSGHTEQTNYLQSDNSKSEGWITPHAGIILLHPFLPHFFKVLGFLGEDGKIKADKSNISAQILAWLATGKEDFFEGDMLLEKYLCNIPLQMPLPAECLLTDEIKSEAEVLLREVIGHWPALKSTTPDGLRDMFLIRNGKLIYGDKNYRLVVERKAQDVLLDKLDWNIGIIKISWKDELLFVDW